MKLMESGFDKISRQSKRLSVIISDIACLIDTQQDPDITIQLKTGGEIKPGLNMHSDALPLFSLSQNINEGLFTLLVIGRFKNGKSTLLNAMLGDRQLPTGSTPTTGVITMIVYGQNENVEVYEYEKSEPRILSRAEFFEEFKLKTQDADELMEFRFQNVRYARMYSHHQICQRGVRLVDSPGLGEHSSRSEITQAFLKESQAIILVLDAIHLLGDDEKEFIQNYLEEDSRPDRVFFVVNRINQVDEDGLEELKERPKFILRPYFLNESGEFDETFYSNRVFWVNALAAMKIRQTNPIDQDELNQTAVPDLERELEAFLTEGQMFRAQLDSTLAELRRTARKSISYIQSQKITLVKPLTELIVSRDKVNNELSYLENRCEDVQDNINQTEEKVRLKLEIFLRDFVDEFLPQFERDLPTLIEQLKDVTFGDVALAGFSSARKQKIAAAVRKTVESYLHSRFIVWSNDAVEIVREDIDNLRERLAARIDEFDVSLANARAEFSGEADIVPYEDNEMTIANTTIWIGGAGLMGIIVGTIRRLVTLLLLFSISTVGMFGFALFVVMLLAEIGIISDQEPKLKRGMLSKIVARIQSGLDNDLRTNNITTASFIDLSGLLQIIKKRERPIDQFIWKSLSDETRARIEEFRIIESNVDTKKSEEIAGLLAIDLSQIVFGQNLYAVDQFEDVILSDETNRLLKINPSGSELELLNRFLIVDAYPAHISPKLKDLIYRGVKTQFLAVSSDITGSIRAQINQLREQMDKTIASLDSKTFSIDREKSRLDSIASKILELLNEANQIAGQRTFDSIDDILAKRD